MIVRFFLFCYSKFVIDILNNYRFGGITGIEMQRDQIAEKLREMKESFDRFQVTEVFFFGSASRDEATEASDIDLLIEFAPNSQIGLFGMARLQKTIQDAFHCKVDLVTRDALHPALCKKILKEAIHVT